MSKNILVTGGFGFVGGHLIDYLSKTHPNDRVHVVDNLSSNPIPHELLLKELGHRPNLTYDTVSIEEYVEWNNDVRWDAIYHLASVVGPARVLRHAGQIVKSVTADTYTLIDVALRDNARLVDVSTSEIYGGGENGCCSEEFAKIIPAETTIRLEYAIAKLAAEAVLINTAMVTPLDAIIVRPFNISGPRQSGEGGFVLPRFIAFALHNEPITVFGNGEQIRAFTHVKDIVKGIVLAMERGKSSEAYNLGNPDNKMSIAELADLVIKLTKSKSGKVLVDPKTIYGPLYEESNDKYPDASKAMAELDWKPEYSKEDIILETFNYMKNVDKDTFRAISGTSDALAGNQECTRTRRSPSSCRPTMKRRPFQLQSKGSVRIGT